MADTPSAPMATAPYQTVQAHRAARQPRSPIRHVLKRPFAGGIEIVERDAAGREAWCASFSDPSEADEYEDRRARLPWRVRATTG